MQQQQQWRKLSGQIIEGLIEDEVRETVLREKENGNELKVCIGTDSQVKTFIEKTARGKETEFAPMCADNAFGSSRWAKT